MYTYHAILRGQEDRIRRACIHQVLDKTRPDHGAFLSVNGGGHPTADHCGNASYLATACYLFLAEGSALEGDDELYGRIRLSIGFQRRWQRPNGLIDLVSYNWESPPDTGFTVQLLCPVVDLARRAASSGNGRAREIAEDLGPYVRSAAEGMIGRGFHTPNHRWVVCSGLSQAMTLFPDLPAGDYVDSILAETIDVNDDGEFTERSTVVYNAVCDRSLRFMADHLGRPEFLDPVRKNLDIMAHLFHDDGTVVTSISSRQDQGQRVVPASMADSFFDMAQRDGNGQWATIADQLVSGNTDMYGSSWLIQPFLQNPEYREESLERRPAPDHFAALYPASGLWRIKRGKLSATAATGNRTAFSCRYGNISLKSLKISGTYMSATNLAAETLEAIPSGIRLIQRGEKRWRPGYDLPLGKTVPMGAFEKLHGTRERWTLPPIDLVLDICEVDMGFDLRLKTDGGLDRVPIEIECAFEGPGEWETDNQVIQAQNGQTAILKSGFGIFHNAHEGIRIGPGRGVHRTWNMRASGPDLNAFRVLLTLQTPVNHSFEIRYGDWSLATGALML